MNVWSLKQRLYVFAIVAISFIVAAAGLGFSWLYQRHVEQFVMTELSLHLDQLLSGVVLKPDGTVQAEMVLSDPRFEQPGGGLYWQIDIKGQESLRSRSLWEEQIVVPTPPETFEEDHAHIMQLANGDEIFALEKLVVVLSDSGAEKPVVLTIGVDRNRVTTPVSEFLSASMMGLGVIYAALVASTFAIISLGLRPLRMVKEGIAAMRAGALRFDASRLPVEVAPLADEMNLLAGARELQLERARQRASNLAHGLKTPLAVMQAIANELRSGKQIDAADSIALNASQMRDLVERELTRSRMADGTGSYRAAFAGVAEKVLATMKKAQRGDVLTWQLSAPHDLMVNMDTVDLMELLGNLMDNARKHAAEMVRISHDGSSLVVEDDGAGVSDAALPLIFKRGVRLDEKLPGSGIGLAIVNDLVEVYGLTLDVRRSDLGGLAVVVGLPAIKP